MARGGERMKREKGGAGTNLQNEVKNRCFPEFWSFFAWETPCTQNTALICNKKYINKNDYT